MAKEPERDVLWSPQSEQDLVDIWLYYAAVASPELANQLLEEIKAMADRLGEHDLGRIRPELGTGIYSFPVPPYTIFYRFLDAHREAVEIARVLHERRDFGAILASPPK
jgi:toxin ParE1/3/4